MFGFVVLAVAMRAAWGYVVLRAVNGPAGPPAVASDETDRWSLLPHPDGDAWVYLVREDVVSRGAATTRSVKRLRIAVSDRSGRTLIDDETRIMGGDLFGWIEWNGDDAFTITVTEGGIPPDMPADVAKRSPILSVLGYRRDAHTGRFLRDDPLAAATSAR